MAVSGKPFLRTRRWPVSKPQSWVSPPYRDGHKGARLRLLTPGYEGDLTATSITPLMARIHLSDLTS